MERAKFPVIDCDGHVTERLEIWDKYLDASIRESARYALGYMHIDGGGDNCMINNKPRSWMSLGASLAGGSFGKWGRTPEEIGIGIAKRMGSTEPIELNGKDMCQGGYDPKARLQDMDEMGIDAAVLFPTALCHLGGVEDSAAAVAIARAYNDWLADYYISADPKRLFGVAVLPLQMLSAALVEMERVLKMGYKSVMVRPNFINGVSLANSGLHRFWGAAQELGVPVSVHPFPTSEMPGTHEVIERWSMTEGGFSLSDALTFPFDSMLTLSQLIVGGTLDRFPDVKIGIMESNGGWITMLLERLDKRFQLWGPSGRLPDCKTLPSDQFQRQCYISFEGGEAALPRFADLYEDKIIWASDYPHYDGEDAAEALENMSDYGVDESIQRKVMGENAAKFYKLEVQ